ncbi:MAG: response regulator transcription factor [Clostridiales bacterium]|nr:response regulator transcription factor [Clostridiales bacterium]
MYVLVCDDDNYVRKMLEKVISDNADVSKLFMASDGLEAIKIAGSNRIDVALLDIDMPNLDGLEAAKVLKKTAPHMEFVFITGYMEYAIDSFCVHPYDYILKPIDIERLNSVLHELAIKKKEQEFDPDEIKKFSVRKGQEIALIPLDEILYFERSNREVLLHTREEVFRVNKTLTEIENELSSNIFLRTHKSFIVNKNKVKRINLVGNKSFQIQFFYSGKEAILSRHKYDEVVKFLSVNNN